MTVWEELRWVAGRLPPREGALLLADTLGIDTEGLYLHPSRPVPVPKERLFRQKVRLRQSGMPQAYVRERAYFWDLELRVTPGVLCPRPETEHLVEAVLRTGGVDDVVAEIGTGSGAVAMAIKKERPDWTVVATEIDYEASIVARENIRAHGLDIPVLRGDLTAPLARAGIRPDVLVMNPPYVAPGDSVDRDVHMEPALAIWGGPDGLSVTRRLADAARSVLVPGGRLLLEIGSGRAPEVQRIAKERGLSFVEATPDLSGTIRVLHFRRPEGARFGYLLRGGSGQVAAGDIADGSC